MGAWETGEVVEIGSFEDVEDAVVEKAVVAEVAGQGERCEYMGYSGQFAP